MITKILLIFTIFFSFSFTSLVFSASNTWDISKETFEIWVGSISPWAGNLVKSTAKATATATLQKIIDNLMIAFWVLALLVMTIGWGYMIMYHGQDELLSKWKAIFNSWLIALVVALSAWILVKLVAYLLY